MAINNSYTKNMAHHDHLEPEEITSTVANFALSFLPKVDVEK